jgi:nucleotide-binding universal stress UspA family protein
MPIARAGGVLLTTLPTYRGDPMIKTILVPATGSDGDISVFASALAVARRFDAHLEFLHVRPDAAAVAVSMAADGGGATMVGSLITRLEEEADQREKKANQLFQGFCRREALALRDAPPAPSAPSARWLREIGAEPYWVTEYGRAADLLVIGRPGKGGSLETIEGALIDSGRPLLIAAASPLTTVPETVVIAWKATREAARAVTAALPVLQIAKQIVIMTVAEDHSALENEADRLMAALRWRGVPVTVCHLQPDGHNAADKLLAAAREHAALLVMGGYGHSRLRELVFGGVTEHVIRGAALAVLMAH